ncbi:MAG: large-conductance mechanosensitive channel protein MscL [Clostridiales bacterium]|nr:large-conductance mechanosensitive channel protein MscL [Clostridiales bacterium]
MIKEFKEFILRGNVVDMAVGVIIGGAFSKIVTSLVNDVIMPFIGLILGGINFSTLTTKPIPTISGGEPVAIAYGLFIQAIVDFLIVALVIFIVVKLINSFRRKKKEEPAPEAPKPTKEEELLTEIRDLLKDIK